ncbi:MAG: TolC family protein [Pseudobdellovibrionaceae bacterium]
MKRVHFSILSFLILSRVAFAEPALTLDVFLSQVKQSNLELKVESAKAEAAESRAAGIKLPPPMVGINRMKMADGSSASGFEVSQTIPFPTKIINDRSARKFEAEAQAETRMAASAQIIAKARLLYFSMWAAQEKLNLLKEKKSVIQQHIKLSRAGSRSDSFSNIHILKAESDVDALDNEILTAEQTLRNKQVEGAEFINIEPTEFRPVLIEPSMTSLPQSALIEKPHQLESSRLALESFKARESEAKSSWFPEFNLRYKQMEETPMFPRYNELMIGVSLPFVFFWEPRAASNSASAERLQAQFEFDREKRKIQTDKASLLIKAEALKKQLDNLLTKILPRAEKRMRLVHNLAPRDLETLQDHRETMEAFPDLKLKALEYREQYEEAVSEIQKYAQSKDDL